MFANLTYQDKQAFFALLDEYFESRPHLAHLRDEKHSPLPSPGGLAPPSIDSSSRPRSTSTASSGAGGGMGGRTLPPPVHGGGELTPPVRHTPSPSYQPAAAHSAAPTHHTPGSGLTSSGNARADGLMGSAKSLASTGYKFGRSGVGKLAQNQHVSGAMGKIGASNFNDKLAKAGDKPRARSNTSTDGAAVSASGAVGGGYTPRTTGPPQPPPSRGGGAKGSRAQAQYDYDGGDATDLPVKENQIVNIIAKTSDDCEYFTDSRYTADRQGGRARTTPEDRASCRQTTSRRSENRDAAIAHWLYMTTMPNETICNGVKTARDLCNAFRSKTLTK